MSTAKELFAYIIEQLKGLDGITSIPMMGGYIFYINGRIFGGIYGKGFMVKITKASKAYMPDSIPEPPYEGAKDMLPVTIIDDGGQLKKMISAMYEELPQPKPKKPRKAKSVLTTKRLKITALDEKQLQQCMEEETEPHMKQAYMEMLNSLRADPKHWLWHTEWKISLKKGELIGGLGFKGPASEGEVEVGYGIDEAYRRKGYCTEAVKAAIDWAFTDEKVHFVMAETEPDNIASQGVLDKLGFRRCGMGEEGPRYEKQRTEEK